MALTDWYINNINIDGTVATKTTYDGTHCLSFTQGISGSNYDGTYVLYPAITGASYISDGLASWAMENPASNSKSVVAIVTS